MLPIPQRYFVPNRIRQMHQPRLEAVGLWDATQEDPEDRISSSWEKKKQLPEPGHETIKKTFGTEKVGIFGGLCDRPL